MIGAGGTMTREAALMGVPTVSLFAGHRPAVDTWLESNGFMTIITDVEGLPALQTRPCDIASTRCASGATCWWVTSATRWKPQGPSRMTPGDRHRILIISPVRNEAAHIEVVAASMARQTRPPGLWLVVDDGSTDDTLARLRRLEPQIPFMRVISTPPGHTKDVGDRHAVAAAPRAFNWALGTIDATPYTISASSMATSNCPPTISNVAGPVRRRRRAWRGGGVLVERAGEEWQICTPPPGMSAGR